MASRISWRQANSSGAALLSASFWLLLLQHGRIYTVILVQNICGHLAYRYFEEGAYRHLLANLMLGILFVSLVAARLADADISVSFRLLCRRRPGWIANAVLGIAFGIPVIAAAFGYLVVEQGLPRFELLGVFMLLMFMSLFCLRNAGLHGFHASVLLAALYYFVLEGLFGYHLIALAPVLALGFLSGTAETSRDTRLVVFLAWACILAFEAAAGRLVLERNSDIFLAFSLCLGHGVKVYAHVRRDTRQWASAIQFLRVSSIRRRRAADRNFTLSRRQDMDPSMFGDTFHAKYIFVVSHAWLSPMHADPDGFHLDLILALLDEKFTSASSSRLVKWWLWYYYMGSWGDVLLFFDMSSLYQKPRSGREEVEFKIALTLMAFLYNSFPVLVIADIPDSVRQTGRHVSYMDRAWCWTEASIARIGGQLGHCPGDIMRQLEDDDSIREEFALTLCDALVGHPRYPSELMARGKQEELRIFREEQQVRGKIFTNTKDDSDRVSQILRIFEEKQKLLKHLKAKETAQIVQMLADVNLTKKWQLANTVFDGTFTTPLHVAVAAGATDIVDELLAAGAVPQRNFFGYYPWEGFAFIPSFSAASRAAMAARVAAPDPRGRSVSRDSTPTPTGGATTFLSFSG